VKQETFDQERTFVDQAIEEAKDIAAADLAAHLGATNPHGITPFAIGAAPVTHTHGEITPQSNLQINSIQISQPLSIAFGGTAATTPSQALANLEGAPLIHTHVGSQISGNILGNAANVTGVVAIENGGTGANTAANALTNLGVATNLHTVTFQDGWSMYDSFDWSVTIHTIGQLKIINGSVKRIQGNNNYNILILPSNCRPNYNQTIVSCVWGYWNSSFQQCRIDLEPSGNIYLAHPQIPNIFIQWLQLHFCYI